MTNVTVKQFRKACTIARKYGSAKLPDGSVICYTGWYWSLRDANGNTITTADVAKRLEYLFD